MRVQLQEVCVKASSNIAQKDLENHIGEYPIYGASGFIKTVDFYKHEKPYVAVVKDGAGVGRTMLLPEKSSVIGTMQALIPNEKIAPELLKYVVQNMHLENSYTGATIPHIYFKNYCKKEFDLPDKKQQVQIITILSTIEEIIENYHKELKLLDLLIKSRFVEMFGDCRTNPKGWHTVALGDISVVGSSKRVFVEDLQESGIPFYRGTEVGALAEGKTITPELFISEEHYKSLIEATGKPETGDLLMPSICPDGRIWIINSEKPFYFKDGRVLWIHDINAEYDPVFLLYTLKDRIMTDYGNMASGTTFAELKIFALKQCRVFDVPLEEQKRFVAFIAQIDKSKSVIQKSLDEAQLLFDSLMQEYFG